MASQTDIVNMALVPIGDVRVTNIQTDNTEVARKANAIWTLVLEYALCQHTWNFALTMADLAQLTTTPVDKWTYAYQLPTDFVRMSKVIDLANDKWQIQGSSLLTDEGEITIEYVKKITDTTKFSPEFSYYLSKLLGAELAWSLTNNKGLRDSLRDEAIGLLNSGKGIDAQSGGKQITVKQSQWLDSRSVGVND